LSRKPDKNSSLRRLDLCPETSTKNALQEFHLWILIYDLDPSSPISSETVSTILFLTETIGTDPLPVEVLLFLPGGGLNRNMDPETFRFLQES
jgi:hypothetical protein